ncbi:MAG TPA: thioredoxin domain-containing protein [Kofleriaceae bacterium]
MTNRLANESSPYLRQHADNPVEWWPWSAEAFAEAVRTNKPVFVSIGYAACHWCHVMAHESFEDDAIARVMNERYINIKVDREERPDVDAIFMTAINVMGEGGGWPLSAFCLPDGRPFFLGTYFPPAPRFGKPSFPQLLEAMADAFSSRRSEAEDNALALADGLQRVDAHYRRGARDAQTAGLQASLLVTAGRQLAERGDPKYGGLGGKPKFPSSSTHDLLARAGRFSFGEPARTVFAEWARGMAQGGIYDHLGGGFARYSVDERWLVPHFEKMLYDQAQLLGIYATAVADAPPAWPDAGARGREVIAETVAFLERELTDAGGGLWSSLDADSDGEEGKFYVWTPDQVRVQLGVVGALVFSQAYGVTEHGNFEHGTTVLSRVTPRGSSAEEEQLAEQRATLFDVRAKRMRPGTDDKVLSGWNGLAIQGLVAAANATQTTEPLALALRVATFLRDKMISDGALARVFHGGITKTLDGTLDDYAFCALGFLQLAEATGDRAWWDLGAQLVASARTKFVAEEDGVVVMYLSTSGDKLLVHRPESHQDGAIPSGSAHLVMALLRLGMVAGDADALALAEKYLTQRLASAVAPNAFANSALFAALDYYLNAQTIVITTGTGRDPLFAAARTAYSPCASIAGPWASASILDGKTPAADGAARAFVCTGPTCAPPVTDAAALTKLVAR